MGIAAGFFVATTESAEAADLHPDDFAGAANPYLRWGVESVTALPALVAAGFATGGDIWKTLALTSLATEYAGGLVTGRGLNGASMTSAEFSYLSQQIINNTTSYDVVFSDPVALPGFDSVQYVTTIDRQTGREVYRATITEFDDQAYGPTQTVTYGGSIDGLFEASVSSITTRGDETTAGYAYADGSSRTVVMLNGPNAGKAVVVSDSTQTSDGWGVTLNYGVDGRDAEGDTTPNDTATVTGWDTEVRPTAPSGPPPPPPIITLGQIGSIFGSQIGQYLGGDNLFARVAAGSALSAVLGVVGTSLELYFGTGSGPSLEDAVEAAFAQFGQNIGTARIDALLAADRDGGAMGRGGRGREIGDERLDQGLALVLQIEMSPRKDALLGVRGGKIAPAGEALGCGLRVVPAAVEQERNGQGRLALGVTVSLDRLHVGAHDRDENPHHVRLVEDDLRDAAVARRNGGDERVVGKGVDRAFGLRRRRRPASGEHQRPRRGCLAPPERARGLEGDEGAHAMAKKRERPAGAGGDLARQRVGNRGNAA